MKTYSEKLRDPKWQRKRLDIMNRDEFMCQECFDSESTLNVHHHYYEKGKSPWDYPNSALITLCEDCHRNAENERLKILKLITNGVRRASILSILESLDDPQLSIVSHAVSKTQRGFGKKAHRMKACKWLVDSAKMKITELQKSIKLKGDSDSDEN